MKNSNTHLTLDDRNMIQTGIANGATKSSIAQTLGKHKSTIGKEIKLRRKLRSRGDYLGTDCQNLSKCGVCEARCHKYIPGKCSRRDRSPGACNGCSKGSHCKMDRYYYNAKDAQKEYEETLIDSRSGVDQSYSEIKQQVDIILPLINAGQSPYQIITNHNELGICEKTLYNYIDQGIYYEFGITNMNLKKKVSRKPFKTPKFKPRKNNNKYIAGRTYSDFTEFTNANPSIPVIEMDTVYNADREHYIQTFMFRNCNFMFGIIHDDILAQSMLDGILFLRKIFGNDTFRRIFPVILTDRGSEFVLAEEMETDKETGEVLTRLFYCDPMRSSQKAKVENNHNFIRDIIPNGTSTKNLSQEKLNIMFSHINSVPREVLNDKTPYELFTFIYGEDIANKLGIKKIDKDHVVLKPYLLK